MICLPEMIILPQLEATFNNYQDWLKTDVCHNTKGYVRKKRVSKKNKRRIIIDLVKDLGCQGKTVVVSSHVLHEVEEMTDTILLVNHGRVIAQGNIYEIRRLIDTHPLQVTIRCDNVNVLTTKLLEFDDVLSVQFQRERNQLTVETEKPDAFHARLPEIALKNGISGLGMP